MSGSRHVGLAGGLRRFLKARQDLIAQIAAVEQAAHKCSMHITAYALNRAKNAAGWELNGDLEEAAQAGRGERPEEDNRERKQRRTQ